MLWMVNLCCLAFGWMYYHKFVFNRTAQFQVLLNIHEVKQLTNIANKQNMTKQNHET